jgi:multiple sugar transport system permease protein
MTNDDRVKKPVSDLFVQRAITLQITLVSVLILFPVVWMVLSSFKLPSEVTSFPPKFIFTPSLDSYRQLFETTPFLSYGLNSFIIASGSTVLGLALGIPAAFAVSWSRVTWHAWRRGLCSCCPGMSCFRPWERLVVIGF